ncbi:ATP synthase F0F1 subunit alpha (plasmid) [Bacillus bombysepticus]|nr:ATP synthase F0F1 subunit alpha [Bacillus bombysepticus]
MKKIILAGALGIAALAGTNLPGLEATKASAAVESNLSTIEGRVVEVSNNVISVESAQYSGPISIYLNSTPNVKIGDQVKAIGTVLRNFTDYMVAESVEKIEGTDTLHQGSYLEHVFAYEYEIGHVKKVDKFKFGIEESDYVIVQYTGKDGSKRDVTVYLTQGQKFNIGEKVKLHMINAERSNGWSITDEIEKINNPQTLNEDQGIWDYKQTNIKNTLKLGFYEKQNGLPDFAIGKIAKVGKGLYGPGDQTEYVVVKAPNKSGEEKSIYVVLTEGQKFDVGDKVKVDFHDGSDFHGMTLETDNHIKKINNTNNQTQSNEDWVWGS